MKFSIYLATVILLPLTPFPEQQLHFSAIQPSEAAVTAFGFQFFPPDPPRPPDPAVPKGGYAFPQA